MPNKNGQLFNDGQRHFVLGSVFVADKEDEIEILNKYRQFKNRFGFTGEIKGSELMTQRNNEALKYFITNVLDDKHFFICNYDKIFYLSTLISVYIFGVPFQQQETLTFYMMASALAGEKEELFLHYCSAVCENTDNSKKEFLEYLISFPYEKLDRNDYNLYIAFAKLMLENKDYGEFPLTYEAYSCKNTVNFVNMTALGEMLLSLKHLHGVDMSKTEIYHDNLMGYEEEYNQSFEDNKIHINFVDSNDDLNACCFCMADRLYCLRHYTIICCYDQNCDICGVCTTHTHSCESFMSGCIQECDLLSANLYYRSTDMLCDTTSLTLCYR